VPPTGALIVAPRLIVFVPFAGELNVPYVVPPEQVAELRIETDESAAPFVRFTVTVRTIAVPVLLWSENVSSGAVAPGFRGPVYGSEVPLPIVIVAGSAGVYGPAVLDTLE
jgi:hypothetical protein